MMICMSSHRDPVFDEVARRESARLRAIDPYRLQWLRRKRRRQLAVALKTVGVQRAYRT